ncbi:MAG: hypothetical protein NTX82_07255 [Candidatus Parcubacteria bacterium]|nr:hypothetical protein [Candidatus Parcubacteria bacterium]
MTKWLRENWVYGLILLTIGSSSYFVGIKVMTAQENKKNREIMAESAAMFSTELEHSELVFKLCSQQLNTSMLERDYLTQIAKLRDEIRQEIKERDIKSLAEAKKMPRIALDLQQLQRYIVYYNKMVVIGKKLDQAIADLHPSKLPDDYKENKKKELFDNNLLNIELDTSGMPSEEKIWQVIILGN